MTPAVHYPSRAMNANPLDRIGLVVHPRRELGRTLATVRDRGAKSATELTP